MAYGTTLLGTSLPDAVFLVVGFVVWVALLWVAARFMLRAHERVRCPVRGRMGQVTFVRAPDGAREDVVRCSLLAGRELDCGKRCLHAAPA